MRTQAQVEAEPIRFRGATLDEAIEIAETSLGTSARVIAANHIRRGGIGGLFATDCGVEISVVPEQETVEQALSRIVDETALQERERWRGRTAADEVTPAATSTAAAPTASGFAARLYDAEQETLPEVPAARPTIRPVLPPVARSTAAEPLQPLVSPQHTAVVEVVQLTESRSGGATTVESAAAATALASPPPGPALPAPAQGPSRRQVELAVAAAEELIETMNEHCPNGRMSLRIALRSSNGATFDALAEWTSGEAAD